MDRQYRERRLTAILSADVVGYSRLMGEDEAGTLAALKAHHRQLIAPKAAQYHGRTVKLMGDGVLMEFGSVADAVLFAVEVQCAMQARNAGTAPERRITYRIGINIGDIIVEAEDIYGDCVNIAARLEGLAEPGGICIARNVFNQVKGKLALDFAALGERTVKNIAEPLSVYKVILNDKAARLATPVGEAAPEPRRWSGATAVALVSLLLLAGIVFWWRPWLPAVAPVPLQQATYPIPDKPSIAVMPFDNLSDDPDQAYFADGMAEDLITDLSKISGLFVIARNSSFAYKDRQVTLRQIAEDLGVRYILEGSVRRAGEQMRINAQLIDTATGGHLWAERYDGRFAEVFDLQDKVTESIVTALAVKLTVEDRKALARPDRPVNLEAYELVLRGRAKLAQARREAAVEARRLFERAIALDPGYARAYVNLGLLHYHEWRYWGLERDRNMARALELGREAIRLDDSAAGAHLLTALVLQWKGEHETADREADRVLAMGGLQAETLGNLGGYLWRAIRYREAVGILERAIRLDPLHTPDWLMWLGHCYLRLGQPEKALGVLERGAAQAPNYVAVRLYLAMAYAQLDRMEDARAQMHEVLRINPKFSIAAYLNYVGENVRYRDALDKDAEIMARIGFPTGAGD